VPRALLLAVALVAFAVPAASAQTNAISTVAGTGAPGAAGENAPAVSSQLNTPLSVSTTPDGGYLIADQGNSRIRRVLPDGTIVTVAGGAGVGFAGDDGPATMAQLNSPTAAVMRPDGRILIADANNNRIREVGTDGIIRTVAGTGEATYDGDGIPADTASLSFPADIALQSDGGYLIADNDNHRIRRVDPNGMIVTVTGNGSPGFSGDDGPPTSAQLNDPSGVAVAADGAFLITDTNNNRVRRIAPAGNITTAAGGGAAAPGDGGAATDAALGAPVRVAPLADGGFLIAESQNHRVRRVLPDGTITTVAGTGTAGFNGDGGQATAAQINSPFGVAVTLEGDYLIADALNHRIRHVDAAGSQQPPPPTPLPPPVQGESANAVPLVGTVLVKFPPGASARRGVSGAQRGFIPLDEAEQVPLGSTFDTTRGTVSLTTATDRDDDGLQDGSFNGGRFVLRQSRGSALTTLAMSGSGPTGCRRNVRKGGATAAARKRRLFGNANGRFRTRGRHSHATVRGTTWSVIDKCAGTLTRVASGTVAVRDLRKGRTRILTAGQRYLARAPKRRRRASSAQAAVPTRAPLGVVANLGGSGPIVVARLDPLTLEPRGRRVELGEYHDVFSLAPNRAMGAFSVSSPDPELRPGPRGGITLVDLRRLRRVAAIGTGGFATVLGWVAPRRLVTTLGGPARIAVLDPQTAHVRSARRVPFARHCDGNDELATAGGHFALLLRDRLAVVNRRGRIRLSRRTHAAEACATAGLAVDRAGRHAAVVSDTAVATVNLRTMRVRKRPLPGSAPAGAVDAHAVWLRRGLVAIARRDEDWQPLGVELIDRRAGRRRMLDRRGGAVRFAAGRVLAYHGELLPGEARGSIGVRGYDLSGRRRFQVLGRRLVTMVEPAGRFAYAQPEGRLAVIDLRTGRIVSRSRTPRSQQVQLLRRQSLDRRFG
jgi:hypothetical protein